MTTTISCPAGFFQDDAVTPATITDLLSAVASAQANVNGALTAETNAAASATAAASSATAAAGSANSASSSVTAAASSATAAAGSASTATTQATNAASSATAASTSASNAATSASNAATSASNASGSVTAAANSASAAATSATNAANSASAAAASQASVAAAVGTIPTPGVGNKLAMIRINAAGNAYESQTPAQVATNIGALNDVGRNKIHNAQFNVAQRGVGPFTTGGYTLDRWLLAFTTDSNSVIPLTLSDADRTSIGDEEASIGLSNTFTGNAAAGAFSVILQRIENVRRLAGKTVTVSFWAKAASGTPKLGIGMQQVFGTGGSPSAAVQLTGQSVTLSSSVWTRFSVSFALPTLTGKTLGTNGDSYTHLGFYFSSGSTNATIAGNPGVQSGTITLWGVQLEVGSVMTQFEKTDPQTDYANCQRFFQALASVQVATVANAAGVFTGACIIYPVAMRATPTQVISGATFANASAVGVTPETPFVAITSLTASVAGQAWALFDLTLSADL